MGTISLKQTIELKGSPSGCISPLSVKYAYQIAVQVGAAEDIKLGRVEDEAGESRVGQLVVALKTVPVCFSHLVGQTGVIGQPSRCCRASCQSLTHIVEGA